MLDSRPVEAFGRETELALVDEFLTAVPAGPSALVLHGDAGIGKSTLWNHAVEAARAAGLAVLSCRPTQAESDLPYLGLGDLFAPVPPDTLARLPEPQRKSLEIALLRAETEGSPLHQRAVAVAALSVLLETGGAAPLLVAIDDAQWLDVPSRRVLRFVLRRLGTAPVGFLVVTRSGVNDEDFLGVQAIPPPRVHHLTIGPLSATALTELLRSRIATSIPSAVMRSVERASGGNPLFALELSRALLDSGNSLQPGGPLTIPASLTEVLGSRLTRLPSETRSCLLVAAALSRPTVDLIRQASARPDVVAEALAAGADAGVIELRGGSVTFVHPLLASVLYSQAARGDVRQLHRRLAGLVQDPEERARHLGLSAVAPDEKVAVAIAEGGARAASRGAPDVAAALFEQAARLTPAVLSDAAATRLVDAADQHIALREMAPARLLLEEAISGGAQGSVRARALHRLARVRSHESGFSAAVATLREALQHAGDDLALRVAIERDIAFDSVQLGMLARAVEHARSGYDAATKSGRDDLLAEALDQLCMAEFAAGNELPAGLIERAIAVDARAGAAPLAEHPGWGAGRLLLTMTLKWTNRFDEARALMRSLLTTFTDRGDEGSLDTLLFHLGELELWAGNWGVTETLCGLAQDLESRTGQAVVERRGQLLRAMLDGARGNVDVARSRGAKCLDACERGGDPLGLIRCLRMLGRLELSLRRPGEAVEYLWRGITLELETGYDPGIARILPDAIEALIEAGRLADAEMALRRLESCAAKAGRGWAVAASARSQGLLAAALGDLPSALATLEAAAEQHDRVPEPFERARTLLALGIVERRLKKKKDAREALEAGKAIFDALGAPIWSELARAEQRRIGGRTPSPNELTATEAQVARLVSEGLTNREVAASMFLSEKTIETNLTRIYEKLAVGSRRELARKLRQQ